ILIKDWTDEDNFAFGIFGHASRRNRNRLSFTDCRQVRRTHREFNPDPIEVHNHKQFGLKAVAPHSSTEFYLAFHHPAGNRRANVLTAKRSLSLIRQGGNLTLIKTKGHQLLSSNVETHSRCAAAFRERINCCSPETPLSHRVLSRSNRSCCN